jgi:SRSO17 transposase
MLTATSDHDAPKRLSTMREIRICKERWRTERMYQDLKGELGLDHLEGRSLPGWHHHVSVVLCCYAFVVAARVRAFPHSAARKRANRALGIAA